MASKSPKVFIIVFSSYTKRVKLGKYTVSSHAQNRLADKQRNLTKKDMLVNLFGLSSQNSNYYNKGGTIQYDRVNNKNRTISHITKNKNVVKTIHKFKKNKNGNRYAYKNF